jgi:hypothetical protein
MLTVAGAAMVMLGAVPAWAAPSLTASPSTGLGYSQTITVNGTGFSPNTSLAVLQCVAGANDTFQNCDIGRFISVSTDATGSFSTTFAVRRIMTLGGREIDCAASPGTCIVAVSPFTSTYVATTPLTFDPNAVRPPDLQITVTDVTAVVRDNQVLLQGTVTCSTPSEVYIEGRVRQAVRRFYINGTFSTSVTCDGEEPFAVVFEGQNGVIKNGAAELELYAYGDSSDDSDTFTLLTELRLSPK